jgi:AcrR family transcriptional regulator
MGIKERHERDREAISRAILDAARELFVAEGYQQVSIRKIAERIEYSPAAIYGYFASKDDIFFALAEEGFRLLSQAGDPANRGERRALEPLDRIRASFWRLYEFSREQPQYFALMFVDRSVPRITREYDRFTFVRDMKSDIVGQIQECIDAGSLPSSVDPSVACRLLTMAVIGVAAVGSARSRRERRRSRIRCPQRHDRRSPGRRPAAVDRDRVCRRRNIVSSQGLLKSTS